MYHILKTEMKKKELSAMKLAAQLNTTEEVVRNKLNGLIDFTWTEVQKIHFAVNKEMTKEELFTR